MLGGWPLVAPIGVDGRSVNLHHVTQIQQGLLQKRRKIFHHAGGEIGTEETYSIYGVDFEGLNGGGYRLSAYHRPKK
ncbi:HNH/ENDO VII family nuclease [Pseudomonas sp. nanlin1]|uniref:HNH/ENDO VII family nuclease n=1 Tax=Pseudomonas sp. nanlin1 TaxID=3040605 RepID=UPI00388F5DD7